MSHVERRHRSLRDRIEESETIFGVISALSLIPVVLALLLWSLVRFFRGAATGEFGKHRLPLARHVVPRL